MAKVSIIPSQHHNVGVDGVFLHVPNLTKLLKGFAKPKQIHAIHFDGASGTIEYSGEFIVKEPIPKEKKEKKQRYRRVDMRHQHFEGVDRMQAVIDAYNAIRMKEAEPDNTPEALPPLDGLTKSQQRAVLRQRKGITPERMLTALWEDRMGDPTKVEELAALMESVEKDLAKL